MKAILREEEIKRRVAQYYNSHIKERVFEEGDLVMKKIDASARQSTLGKLGANWDGPFIIKK